MYAVTRDEQERRMLDGATPYEAARKRAVFVSAYEFPGPYEITRVSRSKNEITFVADGGNFRPVTVPADQFDSFFVGWRDNKEAERTANYRRNLAVSEVWEIAHEEYDEYRIREAVIAGDTIGAIAIINSIKEREQAIAQVEIDRLEEENENLYSDSYNCSCEGW